MDGMAFVVVAVLGSTVAVSAVILMYVLASRWVSGAAWSLHRGPYRSDKAL